MYKDKYYKYPSTPHLPWSPGKTRDDRMLDNVDHFINNQVVATLKMDGENTSMYRDYIHARSIDSGDHISRHWVKGLHNQIKHIIPDGWRICGENLYAKHTIPYKALPSYFMVFSVWDNKNICLSWQATKKFCSNMGLNHVRVMYSGIFLKDTPNVLNYIFESCFSDHEGYVVRPYYHFNYEDFSIKVAKYVRSNHVQTDEHWMHSNIIKNELMK